MSGREVAVAAGLVIIAIGALSEAANQPAQHAAPRPVPTHTVVIHQATTHVVTRLSGSHVNGLEITVMVIAAMLISAGVVIALHSIRRS